MRTPAVAPSPDAGIPVTMRVSVNHDQITIGDPVRYTVEVSAPLNLEVEIPILSGSLGDFTITDFGELPTREDSGQVIKARWYTLTTFITGYRVVPAPTVRYRGSDGDWQQVQGQEVVVHVASLLAQEQNATDIRDIKPPQAAPLDWRPYGIVLASFALIGVLGFVLFSLLKRSRRHPIPPSRPAHEVALEALNRLRTQRLVEAGKCEEYYIALSSIVRHYLEDGLQLRAPEMTTEEFLSEAARDGRLAASQRRLLAAFLSQADLVKFARHLPSLNDSQTAYEAARKFVEETQPHLQAPAEGQYATA